MNKEYLLEMLAVCATFIILTFFVFLIITIITCLGKHYKKQNNNKTSVKHNKKNYSSLIDSSLL